MQALRYTPGVIPLGTVLQRRYRLVERLGEGGAAEVFVAQDLLHGQTVALKWLRNAALPDLLRVELERLRGLSHPHLVRLRDYGRHEGVPFYTADYVAGQTLGAWARQGRDWLPPLCDALAALHFLHGIGLRHGDFKPDNVLVDGDGRGVLIDLGCARPLGHRDEQPSGTPAFMSPELLQGQANDARADLFAVGVTLTELDSQQRHVPLARRLSSARTTQRPVDVLEVLEALGQPRPASLVAHGPAARLLGREAQRARAQQVFAPWLAGEPGPRALWLTGPQGVGRTRLLRECCWDLQADASVVEGLPERGPLELLARALSLPAVGLEAAVSALATPGDREPTLLVMDDVQALDAAQRVQLDALIRATPQDGPVLWLLAERGAGDNGVCVELAALQRGDVESWAGAVLSPAACKDLHRYTAGFPAAVTRTLSALFRGELRPADLAGASPFHADTSALSTRARQAIRALPGQLQDELCLLAVAELALPRLARQQSYDGRHDPLLRSGLVMREGGWLRLSRPADAASVLASLPKGRVRQLHRQAAAQLTEVAPAAVARRAFHLWHAGEREQARRCLDEHRALVELAPHAFAPVARQVVADHPELPSWGIEAARLSRLAGDAALARTLLADVLRRRPVDALRERAHAELAEVYLATGRLLRARTVLQALRRACPDRQAAALDEALSRVDMRAGDYAAALARARAALAHARGAVRVRLLQDAGVAAGYLGDTETALAQLDEAVRAHGLQAQSPRSFARCLIYRGIAAFQAGRWQRAAADYQRAFEVADEHHLSDLVVNALTNLGTVRQQQGQWGAAQSDYGRALRMAHSLQRLGSARTLRSNLASLYVQIGLFERAGTLLEQLMQDRAARVQLGAVLDNHLGELELYRGNIGAAEAALRAAVGQLGDQGSERERLESWVLLGRCALARKDLGAARAALDQARPLVEAQGALDLRASVQLLGVRCAAPNESAAAVQALQGTIERARKVGDSLQQAQLQAELSISYAAAGARQLAEEQQRAAQAVWERVAVDLPAEQRQAFWEHPLRAALDRPEPVPASSAPAPSRAARSLVHFLEINRGLSAARSVERVLDHAIDAAIELTGAERGFVLLSRAPRRGFKVAVARNLDRERLARAQGKLSRSIAEQVIQRDEPVLTLDAGLDRRFAAQASVHAMRLKSVLCVPIRSGDGVLGALYLDNRFERERFSEQDLPLLQAFADQVAIALTNTRLHVQLRRRTRELEKEQQRVQALLAGQAQQIERLEREVQARQQALQHRYDYSQLAGRSAAMRRVLDLLDRVIDTDLSLLVLGESGTGKELIARAVHFNSPRRERPFVGVNCAALPEALLESELFGHVRGAFTGADRDREGLLVAASGGTLFLDELADMPPSLQVKLLRALQEREVRPLGATEARRVDVRLVCATNRELSEMVGDGSFREDLYYRIAGVEVRLPPLRERSEDIVPIAQRLLDRAVNETGQPAVRLLDSAIQALVRHPWPGNVRELDNCVTRALALCDGQHISADDLGLSPSRAPRARAVDRQGFEEQEAERLWSALSAERWNVSRVARNLGIPRNTLYRKLKKYGIRREQSRDP